MKKYNLVYLSLGSNLGDRESNLAQAITALGINREIKEIKSASFYETEPMYNKNQGFFLNTVISCKTSLGPFPFFDATQNVENMIGRPKNRAKNSPRLIDIDILSFSDSVIETEELTLPHPQILFRRFVLIPLNEIAPDLVIKPYNSSVNTMLKRCLDSSDVALHSMEKRA